MALRVLSQEEKQSLSSDQTFINKCKQAIRDFSVYWSTHDGGGFNTEAERVTWVKNRLIGVGFVVNPIINEDPTTLAWFYLNAAKGKQYDLSPSPVAAGTLIAAWDAASSFEEFSNNYFAIKGDEINFSVSGN